MAWSVPWNLIGLVVSGDIGGFSVYTDRFGQKVVYPKAPPEEPPSKGRLLQRSKFKQAQASWAAQTDQVKSDLEEIARRSSLCMTGQNLWIRVAMRNEGEALKTLMEQTGITVPIPDYVTGAYDE